MTSVQKWIKYLAIAFAAFLALSIVSAVFSGLRALSFLTDFATESVGEEKTTPIERSVTSLKIELTAADLTVKRGESFDLISDLTTLSVREKNGVLTLRDTRKLAGKGGSVTLLIPEDTELRLLEIDSGAGQTTLTDLSVERLELELGAGRVLLSRLSVQKSAEIDGGVGTLTVEDTSFTDLKLDMGVGECKLAAALKGRSEISLGIGGADLTLLGSKEDYTLSLDKGVGEVKVDAKRVSNGAMIGSGEHRIRLESGVGNVTVSFLP